MTASEEHRVRTADGLSLALHRLRSWRDPELPPVLLVPGTFSTRVFWLGTRGHGFGRYLAAAGFDCWILEPRGHGASDRPHRWTMHEWIRYDAPAAIDAVLEISGAASCFWVGHSAGGVVGAGALGHDPELARRLSGMVLIGTPAPVGLRGGRRAFARFSAALSHVMPSMRVPGSWLGLGPECEPGALVEEWMLWNLRGIWRTPEGGDYLAGLRAVELPLLAIAGANDRMLAPVAAARDLLERFGGSDRSFVVAGRRQGFGADYGHAELVVGRTAREDVWPMVADWMRARAWSPARVPDPIEPR
jgi:pimeloyl-ACP methyl ester carboxylesterase